MELSQLDPPEVEEVLTENSPSIDVFSCSALENRVPRGGYQHTVKILAFSRKLIFEPAKMQSRERIKATMAQRRGKSATKRILNSRIH